LERENKPAHKAHTNIEFATFSLKPKTLAQASPSASLKLTRFAWASV